MKYFVYILRCENNSLYTGITTDYVRRFNEHISGVGAKYTRFHKPKKIENVWCCENKSFASKLEYRIKHLSKDEKRSAYPIPRIIK